MLTTVVAVIVTAFVITQIAIFTTTIFLHRALTHRAVTFHPAVNAGFRFLTWITPLEGSSLGRARAGTVFVL